MTRLTREFDAELARTAITVLGRNWHGHSTVPCRSLYPHQWSWDSAFIALGLRHCAPRRAATELLSLLGAQWSDGRVPHIVFNPAVPEEAYFPGPGFWRSDALPGHPPVSTSGIIQPPVHAVAAAALMTRLGAGAEEFGRRIYPCLVAQNAYIRGHRTSASSDLAFVIHPWETGMDNSPAWDLPLEAVPADLRVFDSYVRRDLDHAGEGERPTDEDYARYIRVAAAYRDHGYDDSWVADAGEFVVVDPGFNALWGWSELALADLAAAIGVDPQCHLDEARRISDALVDELFVASDEDGTGLFFATDLRGQRLSRRSVAGLLPLVLPGLPPGVVEAVVGALTGPAFQAGTADVLGVPSFDLTAPEFDPRRYWRGPCWLNTTWLVGQGLRAHGHDELAAKVLDDLVTLARTSGMREYFDPHTGGGHGTDHFSWSAALALDVLVDQPAD